MSEKVICSNCKNEFSVTPSRFKNRNNFFCCKSCEGSYRSIIQSQKLTLTCNICGKEFKRNKTRHENAKAKENATCSFACMGELRKKLFLGRNNPNCKYDLDDNLFSNIDSEGKAYLLGWIGSDGSVRGNCITIKIKNTDFDILNELKTIVCNSLIIKETGNMVCVRFCSTKMANDVCKWLKIKPGKKDSIVRLPEIENKFLWHFLRGYFDGDGSIRNPNKNRGLDCKITSNSMGLKNDISNFCKIKSTVDKESIYFYGANALLFLDRIYENSTIRLDRKYKNYMIWKRIKK